MASLLDRLDVPAARGSTGPVRNRGQRPASAPYNKSFRNLGKADDTNVWKHDLFNGPSNSLVARLSDSPGDAVEGGGSRKINFGAADSALRRAIGIIAPSAPGASRAVGGGLSIKGASGENVVEVTELASGTTAADVEAIFKKCGDIMSSSVLSSNTDSVTVRLTFKQSQAAHSAVQKFDKQCADGKILRVRIVGVTNTSLGGRINGIVQNGSVDELLEGDGFGDSKMRSDEVLRTDPRAQVLVAPPGSTPEYRSRPVPSNLPGRGNGRGNGRGGRRGRGSRRGAPHMDID